MAKKKKENTSAKQPKKETAEANDQRKTVKKPSNKMTVRITGPTSWIGYSFRVGQEVSIETEKATELIESGYAEKI